jgi:phage FluMu protein Com
MFEYISAGDGSLGTVWGPCIDGSKLECDCPQCKHANKLELEGKDWDVEYEKAKKNRFAEELGGS